MDGSWIQNSHGLKATCGEFYTWFTSWTDFIGIGLFATILSLLIALICLWAIKRKHRCNKLKNPIAV